MLNDLIIKLEQTASATKRGLWQSNSPVAPWDWRKNK